MFRMDFTADLSWIAFAFLCLALLWLAKVLFDARAKANGFAADAEIEEKSSLAVGIQRAGLYLAVPLTLSGTLGDSSTGNLVNDLLWFLIDGIAGIGLLFTAGLINEKLILTTTNNTAELKRGNVAVGFTEAGSFLATGLIAKGAFTGEAGGFLAALVFFLLGQFALILMARLYTMASSYNVLAEIRGGNTAAGLMLSGFLVAYGVILSTSVSGDFTTWSDGLIGFGYGAIRGIVAMLLLTWVIDRVFLPNTDFRIEIVRDHNVAAIAMTVGVRVGIAAIIAGTLIG
jgi:uncharacterized membrane protein YjfL (UPF0719 family)